VWRIADSGEISNSPHTGFDLITIKNLLTMGSGIRYRLHDFPWDEEPIAYFYPDLTKLMLSDLTIVEPPGQSFHYIDYMACSPISRQS